MYWDNIHTYTERNGEIQVKYKGVWGTNKLNG